MRRWTFLGLIPLLAFALPACKDGIGVDDNETQVWQFSALDDFGNPVTVATAEWCKDGIGVDDNETQVWQFSALDDFGNPVTVATAECLPGGACTAESWTLLETATFWRPVFR
jgi:hypothetical protein